MANIIELRNLTKTFAGVVIAVDNFNLQVKEGEFITILGPSGCGKTTTLRIIGGFEYPDHGRVILEGEDVTDLPSYRRPVNMVFQDYALFPHMTVSHNIGYGLRIAGMSKADIPRQVEDTLRMVGLLDKADNKPAQLSSGQKQRVALARALIRRPRVLLLDEPLSALDLKLREAMQVELKHLHKKIGITFILVTHDQKEALVMSDRIVVMHEGRIVQDGSPTELYDHPATSYVANFIGTSNLIPARVTEVAADVITSSFGNNLIRAPVKGFHPKPGEEVTLCIRPEKLRLFGDSEAAPEGFNTLSAVIREHFFHGNVVRITLNVEEGTVFMVDVQLDGAFNESQLPAQGTTVTLGIDPANVTVFAGKSGR